VAAKHHHDPTHFVKAIKEEIATNMLMKGRPWNINGEHPPISRVKPHRVREELLQLVDLDHSTEVEDFIGKTSERLGWHTEQTVQLL
jgi:hypothetical protein